MRDDGLHTDEERPPARSPENWVGGPVAEGAGQRPSPSLNREFVQASASPRPESAQASPAPELPELDLADPSLYLNRELSWLDFNERVLQLAEDERVPLLERVKFCAIYTTNLDEFYMVRVAGLRDQIDAGVENPGQDGRTPSETIALIRERVLGLGSRLTDCFEGQLRPALADHDIHLVGVRELDDERRAELAKHFQKTIFPALTPLAVAPGRPFPYISNLSLSLAVLVRDPITDLTVFARVKVPTEILPRFVALKQPGSEPPLLVPLEDVIANHLDALFPGMVIADYDVFRV